MSFECVMYDLAHGEARYYMDTISKLARAQHKDSTDRYILFWTQWSVILNVDLAKRFDFLCNSRSRASVQKSGIDNLIGCLSLLLLTHILQPD